MVDATGRCAPSWPEGFHSPGRAPGECHQDERGKATAFPLLHGRSLEGIRAGRVRAGSGLGKPTSSPGEGACERLGQPLLVEGDGIAILDHQIEVLGAQAPSGRGRSG